MSGWVKLGVLVCGVCLMASMVSAGEEGTTVLFDGKNLDAWTQKATGGWTIDADGALAWQKGCGYIWTKEQFANFVLDLDFKVAKKTNSGIFIRTAKTGDPVQTGIEIQVLDSAGAKPEKHICGAVYDVLAPTENPMKPADEWNHMTITCDDNVIKVVLNGTQMIDMDLNKWTDAGLNPDGSKNKFKTAYKDMPRKGFIGFQDHGGAVWYKNVTVKVLPEKK